MRAPSPLVLLVVWSFCGVGLKASARDRILSPEYEEAVFLYARGERALAVAALSRLRSDQTDAQLDILENAARRAARCASCADPVKDLRLRAAVMLHVDRDEDERQAAAGLEPPRTCPGTHMRRAGRIAALIATREPTADFVRRFFLAMAQRSHWYGCLQDAQQWGREGLKLFPGNPALLSTVAAALEEEATLWAPKPVPVGGSHTEEMAAQLEARQERFLRFGQAERLLAQALLADPTLNESRLQLGRVQWKLDKGEVARQTLEEMLRRDGASPSAYLAHLCLGQIHRRSGRTADALQHFTRALTLDPQSQAAAVALSEALLLASDAARAREVLQQALAYAGRRSAPDAHWRSVGRNTARTEELFEALRRETRE
jgi:tetratricopeptide (TPR) repeat protein